MNTALAKITDIDQFSSKMLRRALGEYFGALNNDFLFVHQQKSLQEVEAIVEDYMTNADHGYFHSEAVWRRCQQLIADSPALWRLIEAYTDGSQVKQALLFASLFHDISRFWRHDFKEHEAESASFASQVFESRGGIYDIIIHHDWFSVITDGERPFSAMQPAAELFRLADKTSITPVAEVMRYYVTGKRILPCKPVFDPTIADEVRFDFSRTELPTDELTWFLRIFALQATDFIYGDTRDAYEVWSKGKIDALNRIADLCLRDECRADCSPVDPAEAKNVILRFCKKYKLSLSV